MSAEHGRAGSRERTKAAVGALLGAIVLGAAGCSIIVGLSNEDFSAAADGGQASDATTGATDGNVPSDASNLEMDSSVQHDDASVVDSAVPPIPLPICTNTDGGGWQQDCNFGDGGFVVLPVSPGATAPVLIVNSFDPTELIITGALASGSDSFLMHRLQDGTYAYSTTVHTNGAPVDLSGVPIFPASLGIPQPSAVILANTTNDAGVAGVGINVVFQDETKPTQQAFAFAPNGESLTALSLSDFDFDSFRALVVGSAGPSQRIQHPAIAEIGLMAGGGSTVFEIDAGASYAPAVASVLGFAGGCIASSVAGAELSGALFCFDSTGVTTGQPQSVTMLDHFAPTGGISTVSDDIGSGGVVVYGATSPSDPYPSEGFVAEFALPPSLVQNPAVEVSAAGQTRITVVHGDNTPTYFALGLNASNVLTLGGFALDPNNSHAVVGVRTGLIGPDAGMSSTTQLTPVVLGTSALYQGEVCLSLLFTTPNRAAIMCLRNTDLDGIADAGVDASDASDD